ncbi:MAG: hypothetical protein O7D30_08675 [Rickettsia endosymbiont of Ixodes persulcatus]|nr:hypothetical protein [Rickettsia endosymbiont of Ixodes persulcatus]
MFHSPAKQLHPWEQLNYQLNELNKAIEEDKDSAYNIDFRSVPKTVFRGTLDEFSRKDINQIKDSKQTPIDTVILKGQQIRPGIFNSKVQWSEKSFRSFMEIIAERKIKVLDLEACSLTPEIGVFLGDALKTNTSLKVLIVSSNDLATQGIISLFDGLKNNSSCEELYLKGNNCDVYYWRKFEVNALKDLIIANKTLKKIDVEDNDIAHRVENAQPFKEIVEFYRSAKDRDLPTITNGLFLLEINKENAMNSKFDKFIDYLTRADEDELTYRRR